jgi:hypothetical protein
MARAQKFIIKFNILTLSMKTSIAILFLAMFMATNCASVPSQRRLGMTPAQKNILKKVLHAGVSLAKSCAIAELSSKVPAVLKKLGVSPEIVFTAIGKLADRAIDHLLKRRRLNIFTDLKNKFVEAATAVKNGAETAGKNAAKIVGKGLKAVADHLHKRRRLNALTNLKNKFVDAATAVKNAAKTAAKGIKAVAGPMQAAAKSLNKLTGGKLAEGVANLGCPALIKAIQAGIMAQFPGIKVPGCVVAWFTGKCKEGVKKAFKRAILLRRLSSLRRDISNF